MVNLQSDQRRLTFSSKYSFLTTNYSSNVAVLNVLNITDSSFAVGAYILLGIFGSEQAEIIKITALDRVSGDITLESSTKFSHAESTRVTVLPYDKVRFYWTSTTTFDIGSATDLSGLVNLQPSDWFASYDDEDHSTGYGWYLFYSSKTDTYSQQSNYIPYAGFGDDTTSDIVSDFFSMLSNKELRLITREDALSWATEGYSRMRNKLNLTNSEFSASATTSLTLTPGTIEYDLPSDFDSLLSFISGISSTDPGAVGNYAKQDIEYISLKDAYAYAGSGLRYYIRGSKIGILPTPSSAAVYQYIYLKKANRLSLETDTVNLPSGGEFVVKDYMLYRAYQKMQNLTQAKMHRESFEDGLNDMIVSSVIRDASLPSWGIAGTANV